MSATLDFPLFVALDVDTAERALELVALTKALVGGFKVGPRLCLRYGPELLREVARSAPLFVDNKHFDIPNTMESAVRATFEIGASFCTVHAQAGPEALARLAGVEAELNLRRPFRVLAVTILTSFTPETLAPNCVTKPIAEQVVDLARSVIDAGLTGLVCSPEEVELLRERFPTSYLVTPGVRLATDAPGDQKRTSDPSTALKRGASALVVGRPISDSPSPARAAEIYHEEIQKVRSAPRS